MNRGYIYISWRLPNNLWWLDSNILETPIFLLYEELRDLERVLSLYVCNEGTVATDVIHLETLNGYQSLTWKLMRYLCLVAVVQS